MDGTPDRVEQVLQAPGLGLPPRKVGMLNLRARMLVPVLLALVPAFLLLTVNALEDRQDATQRARWRSFGALNTMVGSLGRLVNANAQLLQTLSESPQIQTLQASTVDPILARLVTGQPGDFRLEVSDLKGEVVSGAGTLAPEYLPPAADPLREALARGRPAMALRPEVAPGCAGLWATWPVRDRQGNRVGAVWLVSALDWVNRQASAADLPEGSRLDLIDAQGAPVLRYPKTRETTFQPLAQELLDPVSGPVRRSFERVDPDGIPRIYRLAPLRQPDGSTLGTLVLGIPSQASEGKAQAALARDLLVLSLVALVSLLTAWIWGEWLLLRRLRVLTQTSQRLAHLDLGARTGLGSSRDEIGLLAWSFDVMAARLEVHRRREVSLLESAGEGICGVDCVGRIIFTNQAAENLLGVTDGHLRGRLLRDFLPPDGQVAGALERTLREGVRETADEVWLQHADGTCVPVDYTSSPMEEAPGHKGAVVVLRDARERTRARAEVEDAHRRVLQATQEKKRFYRQVLNTLTHGQFHLVDPEAIPGEGRLVLDLPLDEENYARIRHELPGLAQQAGLTQEQALDLVVVFGEAASNAIKHGREGRCQVLATGDGVQVRVSDKGPGIRAEELPATLFESGYSTKVSLGMGYTLMLQLADTIWLATGADGTVLQVEMAVQATVPDARLMEELMARF